MDNKIGNNMHVKVEGDTVTITIDAAKTIGPSSTGKMMGVASTSGFLSIPGTDLKINMYIGKGR